ncbi:MAG: DUF1934 domain-containing protein [Clostridium sp.]|jgi:uncharacterized beta-barrel protein YwiB (DUF1934 family)|nr:DUF1934 domain-containing protein [Clostridium sp.]
MKVKVEYKAQITEPDGGIQTQSGKAYGLLDFLEDELLLIYSEGAAEQNTKLSITGGSVTLTSTTEGFERTMRFVPGQKIHCCYATPHGSIGLHISTRSIVNTLKPGIGGLLALSYSLDFGEYTTQNLMQIKLTPWEGK